METLILVSRIVQLVNFTLVLALVFLLLLGCLGTFLGISDKAMRILLFISFFVALWASIMNFILKLASCLPGIIFGGFSVLSAIMLILAIRDYILDETIDAADNKTGKGAE